VKEIQPSSSSADVLVVLLCRHGRPRLVHLQPVEGLSLPLDGGGGRRGPTSGGGLGRLTSCRSAWVSRRHEAAQVWGSREGGVVDEKGGVAGEIVGEEAAPAWGRTEGERKGEDRGGCERKGDVLTENLGSRQPGLFRDTILSAAQVSSKDPRSR
jgi:hypothetical protein